MAKWVEETKRTNALDDSELESDDEMLTTAMYGQKRSKWLPRSLNLLFGGQKVTDSEKQMQRIRRQQTYTEEARLMELLADEEANEERIPDDSELEGSGDDFNG